MLYLPKKPRVMGIVNVTPDSFFDGGHYLAAKKAIEHGLLLKEQGADILDIGGESTRPFAEEVSVEEELRRVIPVIEGLNKCGLTLSIDTRKPEVAKQALAKGASIINDISGFENPLMMEIAKESGAKCIVMHMLGTPKTMQIDPQYPRGVVVEIKEFFQRKIDELKKLGIEEEKIILDPGVGFGKTVAHNIQILQNLPSLRAMGLPLAIGLSRKLFMAKILQKETRSLTSTIAMNTVALLMGAEILRVHDVAEAREVVDLLVRGFHP